MRGNFGLFTKSSRLPSQFWFNQSQITGIGMPNCSGRSFFHDEEDDEVVVVEEDFVFGEVASFIGSQTMNERLPCGSNPAEPGLHVTPSVQTFMRLSVAITTFASPTVSSFLSV